MSTPPEDNDVPQDRGHRRRHGIQSLLARDVQRIELADDFVVQDGLGLALGLEGIKGGADGLEPVFASLRRFAEPMRRPILLNHVVGIIAKIRSQFAAQRLGIVLGAMVHCR